MELTKEEVKDIAEQIKELEGFKVTECDSQNEDWAFTYNGLKILDKVLILCFFADGCDNSREFLFFEDGKVRNSTIDEDDIFRAWDDENPILERTDITFIIAKDSNNRIIEADNKEPKKDIKKLPAWNTRLDEMTKGITQCTNEELVYLKAEIDKEIRLSNTAIIDKFVCEHRSGIIAILDTQHPDYKDRSNGLHPADSFVVASWMGVYDKSIMCWKLEDWQIKKANDLFILLNKMCDKQ